MDGGRVVVVEVPSPAFDRVCEERSATLLVINYELPAMRPSPPAHPTSPHPAPPHSTPPHPTGVAQDVVCPERCPSGATESLRVSNCRSATTCWAGVWVGQACHCLSSGRLGGVRSLHSALGIR